MKELRDEEACQWIFQDAKFRAWLSSESCKFLTLYGNMSCGKTVTASCVIDYLQGLFPRTLVLYVYSRTQASACTIESIYVSLLIQLVEREKRLKLKFKDMYNEEKNSSYLVDPMSSLSALENLVERGLEFFRRPLYVVLDGLDECDNVACTRIINFFNRLFKRHQDQTGSDSPLWVKVLVSAKAQDPTRQLLASCDSVDPFLSRPSQELRERDLIIARCRIKLELGYILAQDVRDWLSQELASKSEGSAIWIDMVIKDIQNSRKTTQGALIVHLNEPRSLSRVYADLFEQAVGDFEPNRPFLSAALEIVVTSRRRLTWDELAYATALALAEADDPEDEDPYLSTLADVQDLSDIDVGRLKALVRPFITTFQMGTRASERTNIASLEEQIGPVHSSLTAWVVLAQPSAWKDSLRVADLNPKERAKRQKRREQELEAKLLNICVRYLLLEDFGKLDLFTTSQKQVAADTKDPLTTYDPFGDSDDEAGSEPTTLDDAAKDKFFDPWNEDSAIFSATQPASGPAI